MHSMAPVACKNWHPDTTSGTYLPPNTREASCAIFPITTSCSFLRYRAHAKNVNLSYTAENHYSLTVLKLFGLQIKDERNY